MTRDIQKKSVVYINGKKGSRKATVVEAMSVREAIKRKLYAGSRRSGTFLMLRMDDDGSMTGRHKSMVYLQPKVKSKSDS